jgi:type III pantothenate kinase
MITLCFDFGNTRKKVAIFKNDVFQNNIVLDNDDEATINGLISSFKPDKAILSSVVHHNTAIEAMLAKACVFHKLSHNSKLNFATPVGKPETIGADRLALCAAAAHYYPGKNNLIIALGSCITYNFINQDHHFLGGSISPGLRMRFNAMHQHTALLPVVEPDRVCPLIGYDTATNLRSGVQYGMAREIDGIVADYKEKFDNFNAVLTGGDMVYFAPLLKSKIFADYNFLYKGLYAISEQNNS